MPSCASVIQRNIRRDCAKPLSRGVDETIFLGMRDAQGWSATFDPTNPKIITALLPTGTAKLFAYDGKNYSTNVEVGFAESDFDTNFPQTITLKVFSEDPATDREVEALFSRKDLFVIVKRVNGPYKVFGFLTGLRGSGYAYNANDEGTKGAHQITLTAAAETGLPHTLRHKTAELEDTATYLQTLVAADPA